MKKIYYMEDDMKDYSVNTCFVIPSLDNRPTGREIEEYIEARLRGHQQMCPYTRRPIRSKDDLAALMDYLELEFKDEPAKRTVACKHEKA